MTTDFLIGAIRASRDLHPLVKTELEERLNETEPVNPKKINIIFIARIPFELECECGAPVMKEQPYCMGCGRRIVWE